MRRYGRENRAIRIPLDAYSSNSDNRVYIKALKPDGGERRITIGSMAGNGEFYPNKNFREYYPGLWRENYPEEEDIEEVLSSGMYLLTLGIANKAGLYKTLLQAFDKPVVVNAVMDFACGSLSQRSNAAPLSVPVMKGRFLYSEKAYSDSWYSEMFRNELTESRIRRFRDLWVDQCKRNGTTACWICGDGSSHDVSASEGTKAEKGYARSDADTDVTGYYCAVCADGAFVGMPLTYFENSGSTVDGKTLNEAAAFAANRGLQVEGFILDRGFCTEPVVQLLRDSGFEFVLMLKSNVTGYRQMLQEYAGRIRARSMYCCNDTGSLFGITDKRKIFRADETESYLTLFYDYKNGSERHMNLIRKCRSTGEELKKKIACGEPTDIPEDMEPYLDLTTKQGTEMPVPNYSKIDEDGYYKGYSAIASSREMRPEEVDTIYNYRGASEKLFSAMKTLSGDRTTGSRPDSGISAGLFLAFVECVIRSGIADACKRLGLDTDEEIAKMRNITIKLKDDTYFPVYDFSPNQKKLLGLFDTDEGDLSSIAGIATSRLVKHDPDRVHIFPTHGSNPADDTRNIASLNENGGISHKMGRPYGSKNSTTIVKETLNYMEDASVEINHPDYPADDLPCDEESQIKPKGKRGRPRGSRNKKTPEREAGQAERQLQGEGGGSQPVDFPPDQETISRRGRGRPPGSRNKPETLEPPAPKRGPGRPKGSRNKPRL